MKITSLEEINGIKIGDRVEVTFESDYDCLRQQVVKSIRVVEWSQEEYVRLHVPEKEVVFGFVGGATAGHYDRVRKERA